MSFLLYVLGIVCAISGLASLATLAGVPQAYVIAGAAILAALSAMVARSHRALSS